MLEWLLKTAKELNASGKHDEAMQVLDKAIAEHPQDIRPYLEYGSIERNNMQTEKALEWYDRAEAVGPSNFWPYYLRAKIKDEDGNPAAAVAYLVLAFQHCFGRISDVEYHNIARYYCDLQNKIYNCGDKEQSKIMAAKNKPGKALYNSVRVSLVKDEGDIIYAGLKSSYYVGFRYFVIADNNSTDQTASEIQRFQNDYDDAVVYIVRDPIVAYFQSEKTMGLAQLGVTTFSALGKEVKWVFPLDADEEIHFPHDGHDLSDYLESAEERGIKLISYALCNVCSEYPLQYLEVLESLPSIYSVNSAAGDRVVCKVAFRMEKEVTLVLGNHYCEIKDIKPEEIDVGSKIGLYLKHYPMRSIEHIAKKATNGLKSLVALNKDKGIGAHWRSDGMAYEEQGDKFLQQRLKSFIDQIKQTHVSSASAND